MTDEPPKKVDEPVDELEARLRDVEEKAERLKSKSRMPDPPEWNYKRPYTAKQASEGGSYQGAGLGLALVYALLTPIAAGWGIGWLIDRRWSLGDQGRTWGAVIGMIGGLAMVVLMLHGADKSDSKDKK